MQKSLFAYIAVPLLLVILMSKNRLLIIAILKIMIVMMKVRNIPVPLFLVRRVDFRARQMNPVMAA